MSRHICVLVLNGVFFSACSLYMSVLPINPEIRSSSMISRYQLTIFVTGLIIHDNNQGIVSHILVVNTIYPTCNTACRQRFKEIDSEK